MKEFWFFVGIALSILSIAGLFIGFVLLFLGMISAAVWTFSASFLALIVSAAILKLYEIYECDYDYDVCKSVSASTKYDKEEEKTIVIKETHCASCGAPLENDVCSYCGTRSVIYKRIKPNHLIDNTEAINYIV